MASPITIDLPSRFNVQLEVADDVIRIKCLTPNARYTYEGVLSRSDGQLAQIPHADHPKVIAEAVGEQRISVGWDMYWFDSMFVQLILHTGGQAHVVKHSLKQK